MQTERVSEEETDRSSADSAPIAGPVKQFLHRLLAIGENRCQLLAVELEEERARLVNTLVMGAAILVLGLTAGITFTAAIVIALWPLTHVGTLLALGFLYSGVASYLYWRMNVSRKNHRVFEGTLDQLKKDYACLKED